MLDAELERASCLGWYRNPSRSNQNSLAVAYTQGDKARTLRPDFLFFVEEPGDTVGALIVDPHGHHLADALPKLRALAVYADTHGAHFQRIDAVAKTNDVLRVLDLKEPSVRKAVAEATDATTLYQGTHATDF